MPSHFTTLSWTGAPQFDFRLPDIQSKLESVALSAGYIQLVVGQCQCTGHRALTGELHGSYDEADPA